MREHNEVVERLAADGVRTVAIVLSSISQGGAERVALRVAGGLLERGWRPVLITIGGARTDFYTIPEGVERVVLDAASSSLSWAQGLARNARVVRQLMTCLRAVRADVVLGLMPRTNVSVVLSGKATGIPVVISERNNPEKNATPPWRILRRLIYPWADALVSLSRGVDEYFHWMPTSRRHVIPPGLESSLEAMNPVVESGSKRLIAVGRLVPQKGFDILLDAFARSEASHRGWSLTIFGEGPLRDNLEQQRSRLGLDDVVFMPGVTTDIVSELLASAVFVFPSLWEGFGNALLEAMALGLPAIAADCRWGPSDMISDGENGILVPPGDAGALSRAIDKLAFDEDLRKAMSVRASKDMREHYGSDNVTELWEKALLSQLDGNS